MNGDISVTYTDCISRCTVCFLASLGDASRPLCGWVASHLEVLPGRWRHPRHGSGHRREGSHFLNGPDLEITLPSGGWPGVTSSGVYALQALEASGSRRLRQLCYEGNAPHSPAPPTSSCSHRPRQLSQYLSSRPGLSPSTITTLRLLFTLGKKTTRSI